MPLPFPILIQICEISNDNSLLSLRTACLFSLCFHAFLRSQELLQIKRKNLVFIKNSDIEYLEIQVETSKTDQYKRGNKVLLSARQDPSCPVKLAKKYLSKAGLLSIADSEQKIFCNLSPLSNQLDLSKPLKYGRFRELFNEALASVNCPNSSSYSCHSLRIGGASFAAQNGVPLPLIKKHGRWSTDTVCEAYARNSVGQQLSVTAQLS